MRYIRQIAVFLLLLVACSILIYLAYTGVEAKTIAQVNSEQMVHAEQAAEGILRFFATYNNTLSFLAGDSHIIGMDADGRRLMRDFFTTHENEISSITRVDEHGIILYTYPYESSTGANISGQDHVRKELANRTVVISDVFTSVQGFRTVAMHIPVFDGTSYRGSIAILVPFDTLAGKTVGPIRILAHGHGWVISQKSGTILFSPDSGQIGRPAPEVFRDSPAVIRFIAAVMEGEKGISSYTLVPPDGPPVRYEAVYRQVGIGDSGWSIIVATPRDEILGTLQTFRQELMIIVAILCVSLFFFTYSVVRARGIIREEAERRTADEALRKSERNYRNIIENMQDAFYRTDREGNITMVSPSGVRQIGAGSEAEMLNKPITSFYADPSERESVMKILRETGSVTDKEIRLKKMDGSIVTALATSHIIRDKDGAFDGVEGIIRDITDRKRTETALQLATKKLNLLTVITTTNIRNAAFTLSGYLELERREETEERRREFHDKETVLLGQINRWLAVARTYRNLGLNPPRWQNVNTTFIYAISHLDLSRAERRIEVAGLEIYADPLLETVFLNLAENFLVHARTATLLTFRYEETRNGLRLIFEDNGEGIPDAIKPALFSPEFASIKGIGLFMAREILEITGITIRETGTYGKGARFEIMVPPGGYRFTGDSGNGDSGNGERASSADTGSP